MNSISEILLGHSKTPWPELGQMFAAANCPGSTDLKIYLHHKQDDADCAIPCSLGRFKDLSAYFLYVHADRRHVQRHFPLFALSDIHRVFSDLLT